MTANQFLKEFGHLAEAPGGVKKLREMVLGLAVRGKLVEQNSNDESATSLLIAVSQQRESRSLGKRRPKSARTVNAPPQDLAPNWTWTDLRSISWTQTGTTPSRKQAEFYGTELPFIKPGDIVGGVIGAPKEWLSKDGAARGRVIPAQSVLMVCIGGSIGKTGMTFQDISCNQQINTATVYEPIVPRYIFYCVQAPSWQQEVIDRAGCGTLPILNKSKWESIPLPLPPLAEQKRIVAKVDELMALCDELDARQTRRNQTRIRLNKASLHALVNARDPDELAHHWKRAEGNLSDILTDSESIATLRKTVIDLAVSGLLVPSSSGENITDLLERISAERDRLIDALKLRKQRPINYPTTEEHTLEIPLSWAWVRLGTLAYRVEYGTSQKCSAIESGIPVLRMNNINDGVIANKNLKYAPATIKDLPRLYLDTNDLLFNRTNSYELVGKSGVFKGPPNAYSFASYLIRVSFPQKHVSSDFMSLALNSSYFRTTQIEPELTQQCGQANFNGTKLKNSLVPLAPFDEQKRIVAKVDQLMALCDTLESKLNTAQNTHERLLNASVAAMVSA